MGDEYQSARFIVQIGLVCIGNDPLVPHGPEKYAQAVWLPLTWSSEMDDVARLGHMIELERPPRSEFLRPFIKSVDSVLIPFYVALRNGTAEHPAIPAAELPEKPVAKIGSRIVPSVVYATLANLGVEPVVAGVGRKFGD